MNSSFYDIVFSPLFSPKKRRVCTISIGDVFLRRGDNTISETQFIATTRYLDVKRYCEKGLSDFPYKNFFCNVFWGRRHNIRKSNSEFEALIKSFISQGYSFSYPIELNKDGYLIDGNHRCGACLYFKKEVLNARVLKTGRKVNPNIDKYINTKIPPKLIESILNEFEKIQEWLLLTGNTFALMASGFNDKNEMEEFAEKIRILCTVLQTTTNANSILIQFCMTDPKYKTLNNRLVSMRCIEIERLLMNSYNEIKIDISKSCNEGNIIVRRFNQGRPIA